MLGVYSNIFLFFIFELILVDITKKLDFNLIDYRRLRGGFFDSNWHGPRNLWSAQEQVIAGLSGICVSVLCCL